VKPEGQNQHQSFSAAVMAELGYLRARPALNALRARVYPRRYNGAIFMGLSGICVKSHGGTDAFGFANAIGVAVDMVQNDAIENMKRDIEQLMKMPGAVSSSAVI